MSVPSGQADPHDVNGPLPPEDLDRTLDAAADPFRVNSSDGVAAVADPAMPVLKGYRLHGKIGEEGQGSIWRAVQLSTGREVALKFLRAGTFSSDNARARFEREVKLTARLNHRNITAIYDSGIHHGAYYYAMEYVEGVHLDAFVREKALDRRGILELMRQVCHAVQHAHQRGIIHRDLKPSNILVTADAQPHVLDFGLAKTVSEEDLLRVSMEGDAPGTLPYMSPEQAAGKVDELDTRTDIYSLGVILFHLLTDKFPHELTGTVVQIRRRISEEEPLRPSAADASIDRELEALLLKALAQKPDDRYESAAELARDIDNYLSGEPLLARPHTVFYFLGKRLRKYRIQVTIASVVLAILVGMAVFSYVRITLARNHAEAMAEASRRALYFNSIQLAQSEFRHTEIARVEELLASCPADLRGWEWHRLKLIHDQSEHTLSSNGAKVFSVAVSLDGSRLLSAGDDGFIRIFDAADGQPLLVLRGHKGIVYSAVWGKHGQWIASAGEDGTVRLWDGSSGRALRTFTAVAKNVYAVAVSPDGDRLAAAGSDGVLKLLDPSTGREIKDLHFHAGDVNTVAFSPDGELLASGGKDGQLVFWDANRGEKMAVVGGHEGEIYSLAFSPDGKLLATGSGDTTVRLWDARKFQELASLRGHSNFVTSVSFSPDGSRLVTASWDRTIKIWKIPGGEEITFLSGHTGPISSLAVSPGGQWIASGGHDRTVKLWNLDRCHSDTTLCVPEDSLMASAFLPDGRHVLSGGLHAGISLWNTDTQRIDRTFDEVAAARATTPSAPAGEITRRGACAMALFPDGRRFVAAGTDGKVRIHDSAGSALPIVVDNHQALSLAVSPDGSRLAAGGEDGAVRIFTAAGQPAGVLQGFSGKIRAIAFSADGTKLAVGSVDGIVRILSLSTGRLVDQFKGHAGDVFCLAYSPDGKLLASGAADKTIRLWNPSTGKTVAVLSGHAGPVYSVAFNPDGSRLVSGGEDRTVRLWDTWSGVEAICLYGHAGAVWSVSFSLDGRKILSSSHDGTVRIWDSGARDESSLTIRQ